MQLAAHIRHPHQLDHLDRIPAHLGQFYDEASVWPADLDVACRRVYLGDEFCAARMPSLARMQRLADAAAACGCAITLLTPVLSDDEIDRNAPLFKHLARHFPGTEVVFNDWGVMADLKANCPSLVLSAGRILDKGFKDPRLPRDNGSRKNTGPADALLASATFDGGPIREQLSTLGIRRRERDLLPYRPHLPARAKGIETSLYFPFGFVTSGRVCWSATFADGQGGRFVPPAQCSRPCRQMLLELTHPGFGFRLFQSGNTIFYRYPRAHLVALLTDARQTGQRLVYQGFGMGTA